MEDAKDWSSEPGNRYSESGGFTETKTKQVEAEKAENEFAIGNSVLLADTDGVEVFVK